MRRRKSFGVENPTERQQRLSQIEGKFAQNSVQDIHLLAYIGWWLVVVDRQTDWQMDV